MGHARASSFAMVGLFALLLAGCSGAAPSGAAGGAAARSTPADEPAPAPSPATPGSPDTPASPSPQPDAELPRCSAATLAAVTATVDGQLAAFAARDYRAAFALASTAFRSGIDLREFRRIIREGYPEVAEATAHAVVECRQLGDDGAAALVDVTGTTGRTVQLGYRLVSEADGWHVDGASLLERRAAQFA